MAAALSLEIPHLKGNTPLGVLPKEQPLSTTMANSPTLSTTPNPMNIFYVTSPPDGANLNVKTILKRVHGLCTFPDIHAKGILGLDIDVKTRWNSTFKMMKQCLLLQKLCDHFCKDSAKTRPYILLSAKWDQRRYMMNLLKPLSEATELLCASRYPTLNSALPVYIVLIQHLRIAQQGLYDQE
ncbi:uncharacterized protein VP01_6737g2 [Puccinia sorghi]|uniref:Uncharacterized protein n=1 Tax=Puccinia sorghi TaxID=27349 RepID=A0A0L6UEQ9_9BASI|nr:uncharacterized protein VP01_6737g2 [Puccinia sorghi]